MTLPLGASKYVEELMKEAAGVVADKNFSVKGKSAKDLAKQIDADLSQVISDSPISGTQKEATQNLSTREQKLSILLTVMDNLLS